MKMMDIYFHHGGIIDDFRADGVRMKHIGRKDRVSAYYPPLMETISQIEKETAVNMRSTLLLGLDYGGRDEIVRAVQQIGYKIQQGELSPDAVTEKIVFDHLDTAGLPDPDFIIRTSGEKRLSGAMPLQGCYAEIYFEPTFLPDLAPEHLKLAIEDFSTRQRRFGGRPTNEASL
jgi:undecaprenyl diphosphate synthase